MDKRILAIFISTLCICTIASAEPQRVNMGITDGSTGSTIGASLIPPSDSGWALTRSGVSIAISKPGPSSDENSKIEAYLIKMDHPFESGPNYIARMKKNIQDARANGELKIISLDLVSDAHHAQCVRGHMLLEGAPAKGDTQNWYSEQYFLSCGFEKIKAAGVEVRYYQRYYANHKPVNFAEKANALLDSVVLIDK